MQLVISNETQSLAIALSPVLPIIGIGCSSLRTASCEIQDELVHETYQRDREQTGLPEGQVNLLTLSSMNAQNGRCVFCSSF